MTFLPTVLLGAIAGCTIFLGLPIARLKQPSQSWQAFLNALSIGILLFLLWDMLSKASDPIYTALASAQKGDSGNFILLLALFAGGFGGGSLGLVYFERYFIRRVAKETRTGEATPQQLALIIATGIGLHNFSEGLAIGQSSREGAIGLATILIIGFALHNMTEGFGIAAPLTAGSYPSWRFLGLAGLIAGAPTFVGTILGYSVYSEALFVLFLALAAGSIFYVVAELLHVGRRFDLRELVMWGIVLGFILGFATDLILTWGGA
ncbi:MAG: ZIP family metal transporter [Chloroflexota bacterium]